MDTIRGTTKTSPGWSYPAGLEGRDLRLDWLRGYALFAMAINHFGFTNSYLHEVSGRAQFLINAAEVFFFVSGMTLGFIASREALRRSVTRLLRRTFVVYLTVIGLAFGFGFLALTTDLVLWGELPPFDLGGMWDWIASVLTLREGAFGSDVLIAYVVYLGLSPMALWALSNGRWKAVAIAVASVYLLSQINPESVEYPIASFRNLAANAPVFFGGLLIGWHRSRVEARMNAASDFTKSSVRVLNWVVVVIGVALAVEYARGFVDMPWLVDLVGEDFSVREFEMPPAALLVVFLYLRVLWLMIDRLWLPLSTGLGWFVMPLGQASLFTYTAHLVAMPFFWNLPWFEEDLGRWAATGWIVAYLAVIYAAVKIRSWARRYLSRREAQQQAWRRAPELVVGVLFVLFVGAGVLFADDRASALLDEWDQQAETAWQLAEYLEDQGIDYTLYEDDEWVEIEINWDDPDAVEAFERFFAEEDG